MAEILRYLEHVAARHDLKRDIRFSGGYRKRCGEIAAKGYEGLR